MSKPPSLSPTAHRALDAHVAWMLSRSRGRALDRWLRQTVDEALADAEQLTLEATVPRELVEATALRFAAELPLTGGLAELVAEVSRRLREHVDLSSLELGGLLPEDSLREIADKLVEMRPLQRRVLRTVLASREMQTFLRELLLASLRRWAAGAREHRLAQALSSLYTLPLAQAAGQYVEQRLENEWERVAERGLKSLTRAMERWLRSLDEDSLHVAFDQLIAALRGVRLSQLRAAVSDDDIEDFTALAFGLWQEMRQQPEYRELIRTGIGAVYDRLGEATLSDVLDEIGVTRAMILEELTRYAHPVLQVLRRQGLLEEILRRQLRPFYASEAFAEAIAPGN